MTNRPKSIGTAAETAVTRHAQAHGFPFAERLALHGALDEGDVAFCPGVVVEVKGGKRAETASDALVASWLDEAEVERINRGADVCPLVLKRKGKGAANAGLWWAYLSGWTYVYLGTAASNQSHRWAGGDDPGSWFRYAYLPAVRITLAELVELLRRAGYGDPIP